MRFERVIKFLRENPRFLRRYQSEIARMLRLAERDVVDLTGRQLVALREENTIMREQLMRWYSNAAESESMLMCLQHIAEALIANQRELSLAQIERVVAKHLKADVGVPLCRLVKIDRPLKIAAEERALLSEGEVFRARTVLAGVDISLPRGDWRSFLHIPIRRRRRLRALLLCAAREQNAFPESAHADHVLRLANLIAVVLPVR